MVESIYAPECHMARGFGLRSGCLVATSDKWDGPRCGEIDIMEYLGHIQSQTHGTVHYYESGHKYKGSNYTLPDNQSFHDGFHVFSIVWQENTIKWYVDYQLFYQVTDSDISFDAFRLPQFFIFNVAVGGNWPGYPDATTVFPQTMQVDYVRVFQQD